MQLEVERVDLNPLVCERESGSALRSSRSTLQGTNGNALVKVLRFVAARALQ